MCFIEFSAGDVYAEVYPTIMEPNETDKAEMTFEMKLTISNLCYHNLKSGYETWKSGKVDLSVTCFKFRWVSARINSFIFL